MARRRRHLRGLGDLAGVVDSSVKGTDVLVGAVAGLAGVAAAKFALGKLTTLLQQQNITLPEIVTDLSPALGAGAAGVALYMAQKKSGRGAGHLVGALAGGVAITAGGLAAKYSVPGFGDVVSVNLKGLVTRSFSSGAQPMTPMAKRMALSLVTQDPRRQALGMVTSNPKPANAQRLGLITQNKRQALSRVSGVRNYDVP